MELESSKISCDRGTLEIVDSEQPRDIPTRVIVDASLSRQEKIHGYVDLLEKREKLAEGCGISSMRAVRDRMLFGNDDKRRKKSM
jgi:hypothetical protein